MALDTNNKEWLQALDIVENTRGSLFLTGKAGTGKSTFLRYVAENTKKKHVVLAPTGIAAINAGGSTIHSFFRVPFHPLLPNDSRYNARNIRKTLKYPNDHIKIIREVELIIIDEISMVRADIIDFIDKVLRIYCQNMREPFGGKQMLFVGDIFQLEPVVKHDDRQLFQPFYPSAYFFDAKVFANIHLVSIELQKVYRQKDSTFISILDRIRNNTATQADLNVLNNRVGAELHLSDSALAITLASRRDTVDYINNQKLAEITGNPSIFFGEIKGEYPETSLPSPMELAVKPGAQVIFVKNDKDKRFVNGTLGVVVGIDEEDGVISIVKENGEEVDLERTAWEHIRYTYNEKEQKIEEELLGSYTQFPICLAWAITIHKSQGLTFQQVKLDFSGGVFAGGQAYVALSRCTSLEGISMSQPIKPNDIFVKADVMRFATQYNDNKRIKRAVAESQADNEYREAVAAFDNRDFDSFLDFFFKAIHSRYDIEKPAAKRYIRRKLSLITRLEGDIARLKAERKKLDNTLKRLATEYVMMGKECEREHMRDAAQANYNKARELATFVTSGFSLPRDIDPSNRNIDDNKKNKKKKKK